MRIRIEETQRVVVEEKTVIDKKTIYIANDGMEFDNEKECESHENLVIGSTLGKMEEFKIANDIDSSWLYGGEDDDYYSTYVPTTDEHIDTMNKLYFLISSGFSNRGPIFNRDDLGKVFLLGYSKDCESYWFENLTKRVEEATNEFYTLTPKKQ